MHLILKTNTNHRTRDNSPPTIYNSREGLYISET